jgi:flavin reductase (DIM6/NTAB) family NADH-FMN oxidoreductase RutF
MPVRRALDDVVNAALHNALSNHYANLDVVSPAGQPLSETVDGQDFRTVMGALPTGVSVLTTKRGGDAWGMTVGSLTSVSLDPALILVCLRSESTTLGLLAQEGRFALSVLAAHQAPIADTFARPRDETATSFARIDGLPVIPDAVAWLTCLHRHSYTAGDHAIVIGSVTHAEATDREPLVRHGSRYRQLD